ncbi:MAG: hypothetical protein ACQETX_03300 [Pseudomonadota bacterium]
MSKDETDHLPKSQEGRSREPFEEGVDSGPMSIAAARRSRAASGMAAPAPGSRTAAMPAASLEQVDRDIKVIKAAVQQFGKPAMPPEIDERLGSLEKRLLDISKSVAFIEAYVSVEMERKISTVLKEEFANFADKARSGRSAIRAWLFGCVLVLLVGALGVEVYGDGVSRSLAFALGLISRL